MKPPQEWKIKERNEPSLVLFRTNIVPINEKTSLRTGRRPRANRVRQKSRGRHQFHGTQARRRRDNCPPQMNVDFRPILDGLFQSEDAAPAIHKRLPMHQETDGPQWDSNQRDGEQFPRCRSSRPTRSGRIPFLAAFAFAQFRAEVLDGLASVNRFAASNLRHTTGNFLA